MVQVKERNFHFVPGWCTSGLEYRHIDLHFPFSMKYTTACVIPSPAAFFTRRRLRSPGSTAISYELLVPNMIPHSTVSITRYFSLITCTIFLQQAISMDFAVSKPCSCPVICVILLFQCDLLTARNRCPPHKSKDARLSVFHL